MSLKHFSLIYFNYEVYLQKIIRIKFKGVEGSSEKSRHKGIQA
jgi:hypothetical protein